jgi:Spx/MgsR family transcriptional regulator
MANELKNSLTVYALKTCDSCKKAITALRAGGHEVTVVDVRADGVAEDQLASWLAMHGADIMINRKSTTWRNFDEATKAADPFALLQTHPTLMKRPVIVDGDKVYVGWSKDVQAVFGQ